MVLSNLLILLCLPSFSGKHPCLPPKKKYIPKDDFSFDSITVYEDAMKRDAIDIPWESLAAYTVPWDPHGLYMKRDMNNPYPIVLESRKEIVSPPAKGIPIRHAFMPREEAPNEMRYGRAKYKDYLKNKKSIYNSVMYGWPVYCAILFELFTKLLAQTIKPSTKK
ncbi:hypothetical protein O3M35_005160 [Rhynocoris fuscipes]|uniref:Uncharacterized protein n=1 Tax=Rhynocoris fuscipes TaxID=488301 RepID=A0AAW1DN51_9HEMI